jgi:hypothetical protein
MPGKTKVSTRLLSEKQKEYQKRYRSTPSYKAKAKLYKQSYYTKHPLVDESNRLQRMYGISLEQYETMLKAQGGHCAMCPSVPKSRRLHVDHDHKTKKVRALLCYRCNSHLVAGNTLETARRVVTYLEKYVG